MHESRFQLVLPNKFCPDPLGLTGPIFWSPPGPPIFPSPPHHMTDSSVQVLRQGFSSHREEQEAQESQEEQEEHLIIKEEPEEQPEDLSIVHPNDVKILEQQN